MTKIFCQKLDMTNQEIAISMLAIDLRDKLKNLIAPAKDYFKCNAKISHEFSC